MKKLSVVVTSKLVRETLYTCLDSITEFTKEVDYEIVLSVPDKLAPLEICMYPYIKVVSTRKVGVIAAVNTGLYCSSGELVVWLADDIVVSEGWASRAIEALEKAESIFQILSYVVWERGLKILRTIEGVPGANFSLMKKSFVEKLGYMDESYVSYGADTDFAMRVYKSGHLILPFYDAPLFHIVMHDETRDSAWVTYSKDQALLISRWSKELEILKKQKSYTLTPNGVRVIVRVPERIVLT